MSDDQTTIPSDPESVTPASTPETDIVAASQTAPVESETPAVVADDAVAAPAADAAIVTVPEPASTESEAPEAVADAAGVTPVTSTETAPVDSETPPVVADDADSAAPAEDASVEPTTTEDATSVPLADASAPTEDAVTSTDAPAGPEDSAAVTSESSGSVSDAATQLPQDAAVDEPIVAPEPVGDDTLAGSPAQTDLAADPVTAAPVDATAAEATEATTEDVAPVAAEPVEETAPASDDASPTEAAPDEDVAQPLDGNDIQLQPTPEAPVLDALANSDSEDVGKPAEDLTSKALDAGKDTSQVVLPSLMADQVGSPVEIEDAPKIEDVVAQRPLTSQVVDETQGAHDAVPDEAQQFMASFRSVAGDKRDPGPGQLPNNQAFAGTQEDATGVSQSIPTLAHNPGAVIDPLTEDGTALKGDEDAEDTSSDEADEGSEPDDTQDEDASAESDDEGGESDDEGEGDDDSEDDDIFGEPRTEALPLFGLAGDGLSDLKSAAKAGQSAAAALQQVPLHLLEVEHRESIYRLRQIIGELMTLTGSLFQRKG